MLQRYQRTPRKRRRRRIQFFKSFYSIWLLPTIIHVGEHCWGNIRDEKQLNALKSTPPLARIRSELSAARRFLVGCGNTEGVEKSRTRAEVGIDKWRQRDLMRAAGAFIFMRTNRRTWSRLSATESDQLGSFLSAFSLWPETNPICFYNSTWIIARFLLSLSFCLFSRHFPYTFSLGRNR